MVKKIHTNKETKICAIYGRVSDEEQTEVEHGSLEQQEHMGREVARQLSESTGILHRISYVLIEEKAISGGSVNRPKYQELLRLIETRKINMVIAKEISRLNRSVKDFCQLMELCKQNDVAVHIKGLDVDPASPMGMAMFQILAVVAELERQMVSERTRSSIRSAMLNNAKINGGMIALGFDKDPDKAGVWHPNKRELKDVEFLMRTFLDTRSYPATVKAAQLANVKNNGGAPFNRHTIRTVLTNERYIGKLSVPLQNGEETAVDLPFGKVISESLFEEVQNAVSQLAQQHTKCRTRQRINLLTGILFFEDGSRFRSTGGTSATGERFYYYRNDQHKLSVDADAIEKAVINALRVYERDEDVERHVKTLDTQRISTLEVFESQIKQIQAELRDLEKEEGKLAENFGNDPQGLSTRLIKWLDERLEYFERTKERLNEKLETLHREVEEVKGNAVTSRALKSSHKAIFDIMVKKRTEEVRAFFRSVFEKIIVNTNNTLQIQWAIPSCISNDEKVLLKVRVAPQDGFEPPTR